MAGRSKGRTSGRLVAAGLALLAAAFLSAVAALYTVTSSFTCTRHVKGGTYYSEVLADLLGARGRGASSVTLNVTNYAGGELDVILAPYTNETVTVPPGGSRVVAGVSPLDSIVLHSRSGSIDAGLVIEAEEVRHPYLFMSVVSLVLAIAGSVTLTLGVLLRLSGLEEAL